MKIKLISINPSILNNTANKLLKLEEKTADNIKKIHNTVNECYDEINIASSFMDNNDKDITSYIDTLKKEIENCKSKEKTAIKELKKIKKRKIYLDFIKKINY